MRIIDAESLSAAIRKRIAQEKSSENLGARPQELRPSPKEPSQMFERMKQLYISNKYLEERTRGNLGKQPNYSYPFGDAAPTDYESLESQLEDEFSAGTSGTPSYQFLEALENFAQNSLDESRQNIAQSKVERKIRTSYESLQSLRRRINERKARKGQKLREYSYEELVKYIFIKRLSVGSLPSSRSTTSSILSKRTSDASDTSSSKRRSSSVLSFIEDDGTADANRFSSSPILLDNRVDTQETPPAKPLRHLFEARRPKSAALKVNISGPTALKTTNMAFIPSLSLDRLHPRDKQIFQMPAESVRTEGTVSDSVNGDNPDSVIRVEGFPHVGPHLPTFNLPFVLSEAEPRNHLRPASLARFVQADIAPATPNQLPRQLCCVNRCRGDPRADKCLFCLFDVPEAHFFVRSLVEQWHAGKDIVAAFAARPVAIDFGEVDDFGDTVLHLAASLGAGSVILSWFISMGVNVHTRNMAGQTFMHVLDARGLWHWRGSDSLEALADEVDMQMLLNKLQRTHFDFNARDDYGQTPMHVLALNWLPIHVIQLTLRAGMVGGSMLFNKDFLGRSVESLIRAQAIFDDNNLNTPQREIKIDALLFLMKPLAAIPPPQNKRLPQPGQTPEEAAHPHAALRKIIIEATSGAPDTKHRGRNGLHCLAESSISLRLESSDRDIAAPLLKRKRQAETTLRHEYITNTVKELLEAGVDPNDYDETGNTPLMAFIQNHLSPNFERKITADVLQMVIAAGASVHRRNRKGETALHIAMRLGRPSAVEVLLNNHANVHSRARNGEGILAVAGKASLRAKQDGALYHRIITCMAIAGKYGAVLGPSTKDEWDRQRTCMKRAGPVMIETRRDCNDDTDNVQ